jgi:hypothetical protein
MTLILLSTTTLLVVAANAFALHPHERDGWALGLSYGGATGKATFGTGVEGETEDGVSPQIRLAHMLGEHFAVGFSYVGWLYETGNAPIKYRYSMQNLMAAATWYPGNPRRGSGGIYLRGAVGLGWAGITEVELVDGEEQGHGHREQDTGLGLELNLGYEFRIVRNMAVGLGAGVNHLDLGGDVYEKATYFPVTLNLGWYW